MYEFVVKKVSIYYVWQKKGSKMTITACSNIRHTWPDADKKILRIFNHIFNNFEWHKATPESGWGSEVEPSLTDMEALCQINSEIQ